MAAPNGEELGETGKGDRRFLFVVASTRRDGNSERLAQHAAAGLPRSAGRHWLRLDELTLPPFRDVRHDPDGAYPDPEGDARRLAEATLDATDLVLVTPLCWYGLPAGAKLYLDHWSGWMRAPGLDFRRRMAGKSMWAIVTLSDEDVRVSDPLIHSLRLTAEFMAMSWRGSIVGRGNRPGDVLGDAAALAGSAALFRV